MKTYSVIKTLVINNISDMRKKTKHILHDKSWVQNSKNEILERKLYVYTQIDKNTQ